MSRIRAIPRPLSRQARELICPCGRFAAVAKFREGLDLVSVAVTVIVSVAT